VEALVRLGATVTVVDNLWRGSLDNLRRGAADHWIPLPMQFLLGDLREYHVALTACLTARPHFVFHLADIVAGIDFVFANEPFLFRSNILINSNVFSAIREAGVEQFIYLGTACSYPHELQEQPGGTPLTEDQAFPANPESAYGWSKLMGEYEAELLAKNAELSVGLLRLHNVYGPRSILSRKRSQVIPSLIRKAIRYPEEDFVVWGSGRQARDFVFVGDVVDALLRVALRGMGRGVIQVSSGVETSVAQLATMIVRRSGKDIPLKFDPGKPEGDGGRSGNFARAEAVLGWRPFTSLEAGLSQTYEWAEDQIHNRRVPLDD
jgi:GDP-D-mannose 3',5'-epimerase